jgi:N-acyl-D-amino-acid deacylase
MKRYRWCSLLLATLAPLAAQAGKLDLVIRHGRVVDGTGTPAWFADIGVKDGRIERIGTFDEAATDEIDAKGMVVAPGFIDVHTHAENVTELPLAENFVRMGVTTIVLGNCGFSETDVGEFFGRIEATNVSINVATLIGHGAVREKAMGGSFDRPPTDAELELMKSLVEKAMHDGALGLSTGLIYLPGTFAKTEEIIELAKVAARHGGIYASHLRHEGPEILTAFNELFRVAREANIRAQVSHIKLSGQNSWGQTDRVLGAIETARAAGLDVTQDQYVYTASSTGIGQLVPDWARVGDAAKFVGRLQDPSDKARMISEMRGKLARDGRADYSYAVIADYAEDRSLNGKSIAEAAQMKRGASSVDDQIEVILDIQKNGGASGVFHGMSEADLQQFLRHPNTMFASDSGVRKYLEGVPHPRGYGNNARVLGRYVRELKLLRLEEAIRRMTSLPANVFQIPDRGQLRIGNRADIIVFDLERIQDQASFKDPHRYATGFSAVLVNGVIVVRNDQHTGARPGMTIRHPSPP